MNAILSARAGTAVVIDQGETFLIRVGVAGECIPCRGDEWRRFMGEGRDLHALADVTLEEVERRLCRACDGQEALRAMMNLCDGASPRELRELAADDLEALLAAPAVVAELEAILYAAPLPADLNRDGHNDCNGRDGAVGIARSCEAMRVVACLERWGLRQRAVRTVCDAWDGLPDSWFKDREERRWVRAVAVREGLFRAVVEAVHAGRPPGAILHEVRCNPAFRVVRNAGRLVAEWLRQVPQSGPKADALGPEAAEVEEPLAPRRETPVPAAEKLRGVNEVLDSFASALLATPSRGAEALTELVGETRRRLENLQGRRRRDRPYFAKSLCRMAELLKACDAGGEAIALLQWALANGVTDAYTYNTLVDIHGKAGELEQARRIFEAAVRAGVANAVTYNALVDAYGKARDLDRARKIFDAAVSAGVANFVTYTALVDAYGKTGDVEQARRIFEASIAVGVVDASTYNALVDAYGKAGELEQARKIFDAATGAGMVDTYTYNALAGAYGKAGDLEQARKIFDAALCAGVANSVTYTSLVDAYGKAGDVLQARKLFDAAVGAGVADAVTYNTLVDAYGKAGDVEQARKIFDAAVGARAANAVTYNALVDAYGKAGDVEQARKIFDAAIGARVADAVTYNVLVDAYGKAGDLEQAQAVFDSALTAQLANAITYLVLLRRASRQRRIYVVEPLVERALRLGVVDESAGGRSLAASIAWSAARFHRLDWLEQLPARDRTSRVAFAFALPSSDAKMSLEEVHRIFPNALAAEALLRCRLARDPTDYIRLLNDCEQRLSEHGLDAFSRVRLAQTLARCRRQLGLLKDIAQGWRQQTPFAVPASEAATRASFLSASGRDLLIAGLRYREEPLALDGARRLLHGWSLARSANPYDPETAWTIAEALESYGAAGNRIAESGRTPLVRRVEEILARGALDGYAATALVRDADLPEEFLEPARGGIAFLQRLRPPERPPLVL